LGGQSSSPIRWGAANPAAEQHCATCHFESDPVRESSSLLIKGLPARLVSGQTYELQISSDNNIEIIGAAIRSTAPARSEGGVSWSIEWRAPDEVTLPIVFYIAATAANDDGSPFGDTIHYRSYSFTAD
jgi:hypothetical protein